MAKKITALERASQASERRDGNVDGLSRLTVLAGILIGAAGCLFAGWQLGVDYAYESGQEGVRRGADAAAQRIANRLAEVRDTVAGLADLPELVSAASEGSERALTAAESTLRRHLDGAVRVRVLMPDVEHLEPQPFPGLGFSALAALLEAKADMALVGPKVGLARTQNAHLNWAVPVGTGEALVLVSFPLSSIGAALDQVDVGNAYLDLRAAVGGRNILIAISRGDIGMMKAEDLPAAQVAGSDFKIGYHQAEPWGNLDLPAAVFHGLLVICGALLLGSILWATKPELVQALLAGRKKRPVEEDEEEDELTLAQMAQADESLREAMNFTEGLEASPETPASTQVPESIFRAYDIRGVVGKTLTPSVAEAIGRAVGSEARDRGVAQIVVARDGRTSGPDLSAALIRGLTGSGVDVVDIGAVPTGVLYFANHHLGTGSGVMVTGSHNPPDYNGFKIVLAGETLYGDTIQALYHRLTEGRLSEGSGGVQEMDLVQEYVDRIAGDVQVEEPLKVVVDAGNGIGGRVAPQVLEEIGCEVVPLYCEVDGSFPNHHPDPSDPKNLQDLIVSVKKLGADLGVALDGDGDRLGVVTSDGDIIYSDRLLMLFARDVLMRNPGAAVIYDVKCTGHLGKVVLQHGGSPIMWKTGHSLIKAKMKETQAALAGEMSGHFFFQERWYGFDDGIYAAARLLEILAAEGRPPAETLGELPNSVSTPELKVEMAEGEHFKFIEAFKAKAQFKGARITDIDGIRADYDDGWGLVRCSNTTPSLVLRFDAVSAEALNRIKDTFRKQLLAVKSDLDLPF